MFCRCISLIVSKKTLVGQWTRFEKVCNPPSGNTEIKGYYLGFSFVTPCATVGNLLSEYLRVTADEDPYRFVGVSNTVAYTTTKYVDKAMSTLKVKFGKKAKFYKVVRNLIWLKTRCIFSKGMNS